MVHKRPTPTIEDYLGVIYTLERDGETIIGARLAEWLEVSPPTVTATIKRMVRDGWVSVDDGKELHLTTEGQRAAASVVRRHMLTELLLARLLDVPWSRVHKEADDMEHTISRETTRQMLAHLDDPQTCPHGNPLPGHEEIVKKWIALTDIKVGQQATIQRIHEFAEDKHEVMIFLEENQLMPGKEITITDIVPFNETITLIVDQETVVLGFTIAQHIFVLPKD